MKKKGANCDYIQSRNRNLKREFLARLGRNGRTLRDVFEELSAIPADRFYISEERAYALLKPRGSHPASPETGAMPALTLATRRRMLEDLRRRVELLRRRHPELSLRDAVFEAVNSPAPAFYLTPRSIRTIIYRS